MVKIKRQLTMDRCVVPKCKQPSQYLMRESRIPICERHWEQYCEQTRDEFAAFLKRKQVPKKIIIEILDEDWRLQK